MFKDREEAAEKLALKLIKEIGKDAIVVALPRGAVIMGKIIAKYLLIPFDILVVKKISSPFSAELAIGATAGKDAVFWNNDLIEELGFTEEVLDKLKQNTEKDRRDLENLFKKRKKSIDPKNKSVIIVDDGVATGATVRAANLYFRKNKAKKVILATPVIALETFDELKTEFDDIIALRKEKEFYAVGQFYRNFPQVTNEEVINLLK